MATIKDVAKRAGVSISTVSLVINNNPIVNDKTRDIVLQAVEDLNYQPNQYARSLVTKQKKVIGLVRMLHSTGIQDEKSYSFKSIADTYVSEMLKSIEDEIKKTDYSMLIEWTFSDLSPDMPSIMDANRVDGMLFAGGFIDNQLIERIIETKIPSVLVGARHDALDYVDSDAEQGICSITEYLIRQGHKDILFVNSPGTSQSSKRKYAGFIRALETAGMPMRKEYLTSSGFSGQMAYDVVEDAWSAGLRPTAIVAGADSQALGVIRFLYSKGLKCPQDVSVTGFEDSVLAEYATPALTTVAVHKEKIGVEACRLLLNRIDHPDAPLGQTILSPTLVTRSSVFCRKGE